MPSSTSLLSPAKAVSHPPGSKDKWKRWSTPIGHAALKNSLCGLLNKLTMANFDVIAYRVAQLAWTVELSADQEGLYRSVRDIFRRGTLDPRRQMMYALLCRRLADILEAERSRWRKVDVIETGHPYRPFETLLTGLAAKEFSSARTTATTEELGCLAGFLGELLLCDVLIMAHDVSDIVAVLFEGIRRNDERSAIAITRFLHPLTVAFNTLHILDTLHISAFLEDVITEKSLSPMVRYSMMGMRDRIGIIRTKGTFDSARGNVLAYEIPSDEYYDDEDEDDTASIPEEDEVDDHLMQRDCEGWAKSFIFHHDHRHLINILHSLRYTHRKQLICCLISIALQSNDVAECKCVGALYTSQMVHELLLDGKLMLEALHEQLAMLADLLLDVPDAIELMAHLLLSTTLDVSWLVAMVPSALPSKSVVAGALIGRMKQVEQQGTYAEIHSGERLNRFERTMSSGASSIVSRTSVH